MSYRVLLHVTSAISLIFGIGMLFAPDLLMEFYKAEPLSVSGKYNSQLYGGALLGFATLDWLAASSNNNGELRTVMIANLVAIVVGFGAALYQQLIIGAHPVNWSTVVLYLLMAIAFVSALKSRS